MNQRERKRIRQWTAVLCILTVGFVFSAAPAFAAESYVTAGEAAKETASSGDYVTAAEAARASSGNGTAKKAQASVNLRKPTLTVTTYGSTELKLKITKLGTAEGYKIFRSKKKNGTYTAVETVKTAKKKYIDTWLKSSTKYFYKVRAYQKVNGKKKWSSYSNIASAKTKAAPNGNAAKYNPENQTKELTDLQGKSAFFLGSSITKGKGSTTGDVSFVEYLKEVYGMTVVKEAVNGTTLVTTYANNYIERMEKNLGPVEYSPDYFVCQLSSNDANPSKVSTLGSLKGPDVKVSKYDTTTVAGAIEYIAAYSRDTWDSPAVFYIPTRFRLMEGKEDQYKSYVTNYEKIISLLYEAEALWGDQLQIIDLWNDSDSQYTSTDDLLLCMKDMLHPTLAGYLTKYLKIIKEKLLSMLLGKQSDQAAQTVDKITESVTVEEPEAEVIVPDEAAPVTEGQAEDIESVDSDAETGDSEEGI